MIRRFSVLVLAAVVASATTIPALSQCPCPSPPVDPTPRATTGPYQYLGDRLVTDSELPSALRNHSRSSSIAVNTTVAIAFESIDSEGNGIYLTRMTHGGRRQCICNTSGNDENYIRLDDGGTIGLDGQHRHVSIAMRRASPSIASDCIVSSLFACWQATANGSGNLPELMQLSQPFTTIGGGQPFTQLTFHNAVGEVPILGIDNNDIAPSAAISCVDDPGSLSWESALSNDQRTTTGERGLIRDKNSTATIVQLRCCGEGGCSTETCAQQFDFFRPSVIHMDRGTQAIIWAEKEVPGEVTPHFNIGLHIYKPGVTLPVKLDRTSADTTRQSVNEPIREIVPSDQISPAVDIDPCGNMVACWVGPMPRGLYPDQTCESDEDIAVYARRMFYNHGGETELASIEFLSHQFRVDTSGGEWRLGSVLEDVHPTVAMRQVIKAGDPGGDHQVQGVFCIAWNAIHRVSGQKSVRGQFFRPDGRPYGAEFDLSPYKDSNGDPDGIDRTLAESNQHTMIFQGTEVTDHGKVFATWTADDGTNSNVWLTIIDPTFVTLESETEPNWEDVTGACIKGDCDGDGTVFGDVGDIPPFIDLLLDDPENTLQCSSYVQWEPTMDMVYCRADTTNDGVVNGRDIQCFVNFHLDVSGPCPERDLYRFVSCADFELASITDCNENDVGDREDIVRGTSLDCQGDGIPDECQLTENDCDEDGVPDDCQRRTEDCNHNGIVDACDIAAETSDDCDSNGVPDECQPDCNNNDIADACDIASEESDDCNENGVPDECEPDCNNNDVADDCDIANSTSEDCNENGVPDECDISRAMLPSLDCNDNDIPDECELVGNDENENGIPDDCEEESLMGGGGGESMMSEGGEEFDEAAAWELFFEWYDEEVFGVGSDWDTLSGSSRFHRIMDEIELLGLPYAAPW